MRTVKQIFTKNIFFLPFLICLFLFLAFPSDLALSQTRDEKKAENQMRKENSPNYFEKDEKDGGGRNVILYVLIGALVVGGVVYFLMSKKKEKEEFGTIEVKSTPEGARVYLDDSDTGKVTNTKLENINPGTHSITLKLQGYTDYTTTVNVSAGQVASVSYNFLTIFKYVKSWKFDNPIDVAVDSSGFVYVISRVCPSYHGCKSTISKYTFDGGYVGRWVFEWGKNCGEFARIDGMAVDNSGYFYLSDSFTIADYPKTKTEYSNHRIQKLTPGMNAILCWGGLGSGPGQFRYPAEIAVDNSYNVYVVDSSNYRIQKFNQNGGFITQWGSNGSGASQFGSIGGIAIDSSGYVYVADYSNNRIQKFTSGGSFVKMWGSQGSGDGQFVGPNGVAVDNFGYVYVLDWGNSRIQKFTPNGDFIGKFGEPYGAQFQYPTGIAISPSGLYLYVADSKYGEIDMFRIK